MIPATRARLQALVEQDETRASDWRYVRGLLRNNFENGFVTVNTAVLKRLYEYAAAIAACLAAEGEEEPQFVVRCREVGGQYLHMWTAGRCQCGALPIFPDQTISNVPLRPPVASPASPEGARG